MLEVFGLKSWKIVTVTRTSSENNMINKVAIIYLLQ